MSIGRSGVEERPAATCRSIDIGVALATGMSIHPTGAPVSERVEPPSVRRDADRYAAANADRRLGRAAAIERAGRVGAMSGLTALTLGVLFVERLGLAADPSLLQLAGAARASEATGARLRLVAAADPFAHS